MKLFVSKSFTSLTLRSSITSSNFFPILKAIGRFKNLENLSLDLDSTPVDDSTVVDLYQLFQYKTLKTLKLQLSQCNLNVESYELCFLLVASLNSKYLENLE